MTEKFSGEKRFSVTMCSGMGHSQLAKPSFGVLKQHTLQWRQSQGHTTGNSLSHPHGTRCSLSESRGSEKVSGIMGAGIIQLHRSSRCNAAVKWVISYGIYDETMRWCYLWAKESCFWAS